MNNTMYVVYSTALDLNENYIPAINSGRWYADGQVHKLCLQRKRTSSKEYVGSW